MFRLSVCHSTVGGRCGSGRPSAYDRELAVKWTVAALERIMTEYLGEEERVSLTEGGKTEANSEEMIEYNSKKVTKKNGDVYACLNCKMILSNGALITI